MPPATPANLQVGACGEGCLEWTWDEVEGADGYDVQYSLDDERFTDQDATAELAATETSYRLTNLAADMDVYLRVRSFAGSGADRLESGWSTHATGMTEAPPPMAPAAPTGVEASAGDDFIEWNWNAVSGAEGYEVQISEDSQFNASDATRDVAAALSSVRAISTTTRAATCGSAPTSDPARTGWRAAGLRMRPPLPACRLRLRRVRGSRAA